jgi:type IV secretion system protein VirB1
MDANAIDWPALMARCAPQVSASTLQAVMQVESRGQALALSVNGRWRLQRQPRDLAQAQAWLRWLLAHGRSADVGLMQVNTANFAALGLTAGNAFDPCTNLRAGAAVLQQAYARARLQQVDEQAALHQALSTYNTGSPVKGLHNGYVARVATVVARMERRQP